MGQACGTMGLLATAYNVFPLGLNSRYERAQQEAVEKVRLSRLILNQTP